MHNNFYISILISSSIYFIRSPCRERTHGGLASLRPFFPVIRPISRDWSFRVASTGAAARWYPSKSGTGREFLGCVVRGVSRRDRGTEGRSCLDVGVDALIHVVIASFPPLSFSSFDPSSCRETTFWSVPFPSRGSKKRRCAWIRRPSKIDSSRKLGRMGLHVRESASGGGVSIGLAVVACVYEFERRQKYRVTARPSLSYVPRPQDNWRRFDLELIVGRRGSYFKTFHRGERETDQRGENYSSVDCRARCNISRRGEKKREKEIKLQNIRPRRPRDGPRTKQSSRCRLRVVISKGGSEKSGKGKRETRQSVAISARRARERSSHGGRAREVEWTGDNRGFEWVGREPVGLTGTSWTRCQRATSVTGIGPS